MSVIFSDGMMLFLSSASKQKTLHEAYYSVPVGVQSIVISPSVHLSVCVSVHISGTAGSIFTKFCVQLPCGRGLVLLWRRCDTLCTRGDQKFCNFDIKNNNKNSMTLSFFNIVSCNVNAFLPLFW